MNAVLGLRQPSLAKIWKITETSRRNGQAKAYLTQLGHQTKTKKAAEARDEHLSRFDIMFTPRGGREAFPLRIWRRSTGRHQIESGLDTSSLIRSVDERHTIHRILTEVDG